MLATKLTTIFFRVSQLRPSSVADDFGATCRAHLTREGVELRYVRQSLHLSLPTPHFHAEQRMHHITVQVEAGTADDAA